MNRFPYFLTAVSILFLFIMPFGYSDVNIDDNMMWGLPLAGGPGSQEADVDICPQGARVVSAFLKSWERGDYKSMYQLLDPQSKVDYPFEDARFDFQFMEYKDYKISSVRESGKNFEFVLSYGNWKEGDKELKKLTISGTTFKIITPSRGEIFKKSASDYF